MNPATACAAIVFALMSIGTASAQRAGDGHVSQSSFEASDKTWPFTVREGSVGCTAASEINGAPRSWVAIHGWVPWFRTPSGQTYALARFAFGRQGFLDPAPIWIVDRERAHRDGATEAQLVHYRASWLDLQSEAEQFCR